MGAASPMVGADIMARQWQRYSAVYGAALRLDPAYDEAQCSECPHDHSCCDLAVSITPYEGLGILSWLKMHAPDWQGVLERVRMRAAVWRDFFQHGEFGDLEAAFGAWFKRGLRCVFYDRAARRCSIYPVRPLACRKAFGQGDCGDGAASGVKSVQENPQLMAVRAARVRVGQLQAIGQTRGELCSMIALLLTPNVLLRVDERDQALFQTEPMLLSDEALLWGMEARPAVNPAAEEIPHGNS